MSSARLVWLVARREVREAVRGRQFLISTALVLVLLGAIVLVSVFFGKKNTVQVGLGGAAPAGLVRALDAAARQLGTHVTLHHYASAALARDAVAHRQVDVAFAAGGHRLLVRGDSSGTALAVAGAAARSAFLAERARSIGITPAQARAALAPPYALARVEPAAGAGDHDRGFAFATTIVLFIAVQIYGQAVLMSVVQEKASRVVEVLLAAVRPRHLLAGKVAGIGALGLSQVFVVALAALVAGLSGAFALPSAGRTAPLAVLWFVLGFAFYAVAYASAGALVSRMEDAQNVAVPVSMTMAVGYVLSLAALPNPGGGLATVLSLVPLWAPFVVPGRVALGAIPAWEQALSLVLTLLGIWLLVRVAGRVYELSLLRIGPRVPFREALQAARRATA